MRITAAKEPASEAGANEPGRRSNRDLLLDLIRSRQPISRADLARDSGIRPSTVSSIVDELKVEGWVTEGGSVARPRGRRPTMLSLNDRVAVLVADVHPRHAIVALIDLPGRLLARRVIPLASQPQRAIQSIADSMKTMVSEHPGMNFAGIGVSLPGRIDPATQHLMFAPNLLDAAWINFDIRAEFESRMKLPVELENDANGCLLSELWFGRMQATRDAVLVAIDEGVGTALLTNGRIVRGKAGMAGEFGHVQLDPAGPLCACGQRGCWEMLAASPAALRYYAELDPAAAVPTISGLLHLAEEGDANALAALTRQAEYIGKGLRLLVASLAPEVILVTGVITSLWSIFGSVIEKQLSANLLAGVPPRLEPAADAESARLRGAAVVLLQRVSGQTRG
jgi:predicted NBD/HSP70 family sugar kinase